MDDSDPTPFERKSKRGTSALIVEWWREGGAADDECTQALRGNLWDLSSRRRKLGAFAGFDGLVTLLRRLIRDDSEGD